MKSCCPLSMTVAVTATVTGYLVSHLNRYRSLAVIGAVIATFGALLLAQMSAGTSHLTLIRNVVITGFGLGIAMPIYGLTVQNAAHVTVMGVASSLVYFVRSMAASIGVAVFGTIVSTQTKAGGLIRRSQFDL